MKSYSFKGSRDPFLPAQNRGKMYPQFTTLSVRFYIPHLDIFLFEMQNVTAACSTILFNNLIPIKNSYFNDYQGLSDVSKGNVQVEKPGMPIFF